MFIQRTNTGAESTLVTLNIYVILDGTTKNGVVWESEDGNCRILVTEDEISPEGNPHFFEITPYEEYASLETYYAQIKEIKHGHTVVDFTTSKAEIFFGDKNSISVRSSLDTLWLRTKVEDRMFNLDIFSGESFERQAEESGDLQPTDIIDKHVHDQDQNENRDVDGDDDFRPGRVDRDLGAL